MTAADVTTIKVTKKLRDRITARAVERDQTVQGFMEKVLDDYDPTQRLAAVAAAMNTADEETLKDWRAETNVWATLKHDLDGPQ